MKKFSLFISLSFIVIIFITGCENSSSNWVKYKKDNDGNVYLYNKVDIKKDVANNMVQVWGKQVYSDTGKTIELQSRIKDGLSIEGYDKLSGKQVLYGIDCKKKSISVLSIIHYDKDGKVLYSGGDTSEKKWFDIKPDSTADALQTEVCPQ